MAFPTHTHTHTHPHTHTCITPTDNLTAAVSVKHHKAKEMLLLQNFANEAAKEKASHMNAITHIGGSRK